MKPRILVVDDEPLIAENLSLVFEREGYEVDTAGQIEAAMERMEGREFSMAVIDLVLPDGDGLELLGRLKGKDPSLEIIMMTGHASISKAIEATKQGAFYVGPKPFDTDEMLMLVSKALERRRLLAETSELRRKLADQSGYAQMLGTSPAMKRVFELLESVAASDANVLVVGESGTGKELAANAVHAKSARTGGPLVKINCAALPKDLIESELFGHVKGAFTGATTDRAGLLEEAHRGSLLLDEITEMPADLQAKLLRVLEDRTVRRLGGSRLVPVDFRLVCSTNLDPSAAVREGRLRQDLYFRINTITITLPPLRDRTADIPLLAKSFLERFRSKHAREIEGIDPEAYRRLLAHRWPGNVRELEHAIELGVLVARGREVKVIDLPEAVQALAGSDDGAAAPPPGSLEEIERVSIVPAL